MHRHVGRIKEILDAHNPKALFEIGVLKGASTLRLLEWCSENNAHLTSLDPVRWEGDIPEDIKAPASGYLYKRGQAHEQVFLIPTYIEEVYKNGLDKYWTCIKMRSLDYFKTDAFSGFDAYFIDGDHNYFTVISELNVIYEKAHTGTIVVLHDVSRNTWARRDQYYDESLIPKEFIRGKKQGVLTAIEDFLDAHCEKKILSFRKNSEYSFKILSRKNDGLGLLRKIR